VDSCRSRAAGPAVTCFKDAQSRNQVLLPREGEREGGREGEGEGDRGRKGGGEGMEGGWLGGREVGREASLSSSRTVDFNKGEPVAEQPQNRSTCSRITRSVCALSEFMRADMSSIISSRDMRSFSFQPSPTLLPAAAGRLVSVCRQFCFFCFYLLAIESAS
jgi:hypothetical protein